ncbi:c-type cytochrome [Algoriphagus halophilus]|uniref:c-type cytochrome n=1 Tax=Algoriphagus halophilus TaxID=226505 RepID=UPI00358E8CC4
MKAKRSLLLEEKMALNNRKNQAKAMAKDPLGGQMLMEMLVSNSLPADLIETVKETIPSNPNLGVRVQAGNYFGSKANGENYAIDHLKSLNSDVLRGEAAFKSFCTTCHSVNGEGKDIGPDLSQIKTKYDQTTLLDAIINPNGGIVFGYEPWLVKLKSGESYYGFIQGETKETLIIKDLSGKRITLSLSEIDQKKQEAYSIMPDPASLGMKAQELADISTYLLNLR